MRRSLTLAFAAALVPCAARAALPGEIPIHPEIAVPVIPAMPMIALVPRLNAAAPALSLPSAPSPLPVALPVSLPSAVRPAPIALRLDPVGHELDWSFLGGSGSSGDAVPAAPSPRPLSPSTARVRVQRAAQRALVSADAVFDGAENALASIGW